MLLATDCVTINISGVAHGGVAEALGDGGEVHAVGQQQARVAVSQDVERGALGRPAFGRALPQSTKPNSASGVNHLGWRKSNPGRCGRRRRIGGGTHSGGVGAPQAQPAWNGGFVWQSDRSMKMSVPLISDHRSANTSPRRAPSEAHVSRNAGKHHGLRAHWIKRSCSAGRRAIPVRFFTLGRSLWVTGYSRPTSAS